jgi:hypothetical protein
MSKIASDPVLDQSIPAILARMDRTVAAIGETIKEIDRIAARLGGVPAVPETPALLPTRHALDSELQAVIANGHPAFPDEPGPSDEDLAWAAREYERKYGGTNDGGASDDDLPMPVERDWDDVLAEFNPMTVNDLVASIGAYLTGLGCEPKISGITGDTLTCKLGSRTVQVTIEDLDERVEPEPGQDGDGGWAAMLATGMDWPAEVGPEERREAMADLVRFYAGRSEA